MSRSPEQQGPEKRLLAAQRIYTLRNHVPEAWEVRGGDMPGRQASRRSKICKAIRDATAILLQLRILAAELVFTLAALYGLYHAFVLLTK